MKTNLFTTKTQVINDDKQPKTNYNTCETKHNNDKKNL